MFREVATAVPPLPPGIQIVTADEVGQWYWGSDQIEWSLDQDFGPLVPPFDALWIEYTPPAMCRYANGWRPRTNDGHGFLLLTLRRPDGSWGVTGHHILVARKQLVMSMMSVRMRLSPDGSYDSHDIALHDRQCMADLTATEEDLGLSIGDLTDACSAFWHVPLLAVSLMNCKNVKLESVTPSAKLSKKHGVALAEHSKIRLPAGLRGLSTTKAREQGKAGPPQPLHVVRGHFKTYTEEAPLFGKNTGTYWWGWQARGSSSAGERKHDYEVGPRT